MVDELNGDGDAVTYSVYPGVDHGAIVGAAEDEALAFYESRLPPAP